MFRRLFVYGKISVDIINISSRAMMGEFIIYYRGKAFGGIYDDRLLVKSVPVAVKMMTDAEMEPPYAGAKKMILVDDVDNRQFLCELVESMWEELPKKEKLSFGNGNRHNYSQNCYYHSY